jgi:hypothetical protein
MWNPRLIAPLRFALAGVYMILGLTLAGGAIIAMLKFAFGANVNGILEAAGRIPRITDGLTLEHIIFGGALVFMWLIVTVSLLHLAAFVFNRGRRLKARTAQSLLKNDPRPPILYLRPFDSDPFERTVLPDFFSDEEQICAPFSDLGPTIAIASPGEELAPSGAGRLELKDSWQDGVTMLLGSSQRILVRVDSTSGLLWEIKTIIAKNEPQKLLLFALGRTTVYARFLRDAEAEFPKGLPAISSMLGEDTGHVEACIRFDESWEHTVIRLDRRGLIARLERAIERSPLCGPNGPIPPVSLRRRIRRSVGLVASLAIMFFAGPYVCNGAAVVLAAPTEFLSLCFTKSHIQAFSEVFPADLREPIQSELSRNPDVTAWINSSEPSDWLPLSHVASNGIGKLSGNDKIIAVTVLYKILKTLEPQNCNKTLLSLSNDVTGRAAFLDLVIMESRAGAEPERARLVVAALAARKYGFIGIQPGPDDTAFLKHLLSSLPPQQKSAFLEMPMMTSSQRTAGCETMMPFLNVALTAAPPLQDQLVAFYFNYYLPFSDWR